MNVSCRDLKRNKQIQGAMAAIRAFQTSDDFATGGLYITCRSLQCLNAWLFIHAYHQGIVRWIQVEPDYIRRFCSKLFVSADAPATLPLKTNAFFAKHSPHRVFGALDNLATDAPSHMAWPSGGGLSRVPSTWLRKSAPYFFLAPGLGASARPAIRLMANRFRHLMMVFARV